MGSRIISLKTALKAVASENVTFSPEFPHVIQACTGYFNMPLDEFETYFKGNEEILAILKSIQHHS